MKQLVVLVALWTMAVTAGAQTATTFEMRYFTPDAAADGVTDFHGETEWFTTPQRVEMLGKYARYASRFWGDPGLDTPLFGESVITEALSRIKPQPLTTVRHPDEPATPYRSELVFEEDFEKVPSLEGWQEGRYDDAAWQAVTLPSSHGGAAQAGEDYYLRTRVMVGSFTQAFLHLDALDPDGRSVTRLAPFRFRSRRSGCHFIVYQITVL